MGIVETLADRYRGQSSPLLIDGDRSLGFDDIVTAPLDALSAANPGDVVALIGNFDAVSIHLLLRLIDLPAVLVPLSPETRPDHDYFFESAHVDLVIDLTADAPPQRRPKPPGHDLLTDLRARSHPGLVLFSSGTTGRPKAILHDLTHFLNRYGTPRPTLRTLSFLLFDHIGGLNTLLHTLYNRGTVVVPSDRSPAAILRDAARHRVELLPTTPTFLRMMLMSGLIPDAVPESLRLITYGTERMDAPTLDRLAELLPAVDFRQTYGMSELGILRVKSRARGSLWMSVGGEGVETRIADGSLHIRARDRMLGYLNAPSPFDEEGWYDSQDLVERDGDWLRITGRRGDQISIGGVKALPSEIERAALLHPDVAAAKAIGAANPITGQHIELTCELVPDAELDRPAMKRFLRQHLSAHLQPHRIRFGPIARSHRFKSR